MTAAAQRVAWAAAIGAGLGAVYALARPGKAQAVRLADVFGVGPIMVLVALPTAGRPEPLRLLVAAAGGATVTFNGLNWWRERRRTAPVAVAPPG